MQYRERRKPTEFQLTLLTEAGPLSVEVRDIHALGARVLIGDRGLWVDTNVELSLQGRKFPATVAWSRDGEAGIAFTPPLPADVLGRISRSPKKPGPGRHWRFPIG